MCVWNELEFKELSWHWPNPDLKLVFPPYACPQDELKAELFEKRSDLNLALDSKSGLWALLSAKTDCNRERDDERDSDVALVMV